MLSVCLLLLPVALRKESVDRNGKSNKLTGLKLVSLSARRAWIEIEYRLGRGKRNERRSPQGERG